MYEFHYDYVKRKYDSNKFLLCYMDTDSLLYHISNNVEERFDMSGYNKENTKPLPIRKNKKVIGIMKDKLGGSGHLRHGDFFKGTKISTPLV